MKFFLHFYCHYYIPVLWVLFTKLPYSASIIFADGWTLTGGLREGAFKRGPVASVVWPGLACLLFDFDASVSRTCAELSWGWGCIIQLSNPIGWCIVFLGFFSHIEKCCRKWNCKPNTAYVFHRCCIQTKQKPLNRAAYFFDNQSQSTVSRK